MVYRYPKLNEARKKARRFGAMVWSSQKYPYKLYTVVGGREVHFGHREYSDFLQHKDPVRRRNYRSRHSNDNINDPRYPGFWSYWILW